MIVFNAAMAIRSSIGTYHVIKSEVPIESSLPFEPRLNFRGAEEMEAEACSG